MVKSVVFMGPSRPQNVTLPDHATVRGPAVSGDLYTAVIEDFDLIALVDASFQDMQTVQHKEILFALESGVRVWGAASMGALRAVECEAFGMQGFGEIFAAYRRGDLIDDHEVAVDHGPADIGYPILTEPLVNIRWTLKKAIEKGVVNFQEAEELLAKAINLPFRDLNWAALDCPHVAEMAIDQKRCDAATLIEALHATHRKQDDLPPPAFSLNRTRHWIAFEDRHGQITRLSTEDAAVLNELRLNPVRYRAMLLRAAALVAFEEGTGADGTFLEDFRSDLGLFSSNAFQGWLERNRISAAHLEKLLEQESAFENALDDAAQTLERTILDELRLSGEFELLQKRAAEKKEQLNNVSTNLSPDVFRIDLDILLQWFCETRDVQTDTSDTTQTARSLGLKDSIALHGLLRNEFEFCQKVNDAK